LISDFKIKKNGERQKHCYLCLQYHQKYRQDHQNEKKQNYQQYYQLNKEVIQQQHQQYRFGDDLDHIIQSKICTYHHKDENHHRVTQSDQIYISVDYIKDLIQQSGPICKYCGVEMSIINRQPNDSSQFTVNRINNELPHIQGNVEICCWQCNVSLH